MSAISHRPRAANSADNSSNTNKTTVIIIAVSASVGGILLTVLLYRLVRTLYRRATARALPLPPVQPLAHHRAHFHEQKPASPSRPATWYDSGQLSAPTIFLAKGSNSSLTPTVEGDSLRDLSQYSPMEHTPYIPRPSTAATTPSLIESDEVHPHPPITPNTYASFQPRNSSPSPARYPRARPLSMGSINTQARRSSKSPSHIRGAPHRPHSQIQIVLPAPLSMTLSPYTAEGGNTRSSHADEKSNRFSLVDAWAPMPVRSTSSLSERHSRSFDHEQRPTGPFSGPDHIRCRSVSSPQASVSSFQSSPSGQPPPVPRIPSIYDTNTPVPDEQLQSRSRSLSISSSAQSHHVDQVAPLYPSSPQWHPTPNSEEPQLQSCSASLVRTPSSPHLAPSPD